jgi:hypothetical protein
MIFQIPLDELMTARPRELIAEANRARLAQQVPTPPRTRLLETVQHLASQLRRNRRESALRTDSGLISA